MTILANVILPVFALPYFSAVFFPVAGVAAIASEVGIYRLMNRQLLWRKIAFLVLWTNTVSTGVGFGIGMALSEYLPGSSSITYAILGYILALVLSILIEYALVKVSRQAAPLDKTFTPVALANIVSYLILIVVTFVMSLLL